MVRQQRHFNQPRHDEQRSVDAEAEVRPWYQADCILRPPHRAYSCQDGIWYIFAVVWAGAQDTYLDETMYITTLVPFRAT
jgi:hypothetical protein